jgi:hypothetical protein
VGVGYGQVRTDLPLTVVRSSRNFGTAGFTRRSFERLAAGAGLEVRRREGTGTPSEVLGRHAGCAYRKPAVERAQTAAVALRPTLFAYQFVYELRPLARPDERDVVTDERIEPISGGEGAGRDVTASSVPA